MLSRKIKALVLLSGGLDSMLAAKILMEQGIEVTGLSFASHFFNTVKARGAAEQLGIKLIEADFRDEHLTIVKSPEHGYGSNMNPCVDCHGLMLKKAKEIMGKENYDFVATGEVLGQRPMSQNKEALKQVAKIASLAGRLLRPLSAQLLDLTELEKEGKINRKKLLAISGRSRKKQQELAKIYSLNYPSPAGGCLLTDPGFSERLAKMFEFWSDCSGADIELLKYGRIFWLILSKQSFSKKVLCVIGRNQDENEALLNLAARGDIIMELKDEVGPTTLIRFKNYDLSLKNKELKIVVPELLESDKLNSRDEKDGAEILKTAALLTGFYAKKARGKRVKMKIRQI